MPNMREIARRAGVSYTTVSYVLSARNSPRGISEATRQKVLQIAGELGYRRNELARAVVTGRRAILGFVADAHGNNAEYLARVLTGAAERASERGLLLKTLQIGSEADIASAAEQCAAWRVAGVVAVALRPEHRGSLIDALERHGISQATVEDVPTGGPEKTVLSDEACGMGEALAHLKALGHSRIAYLAAAKGEPVSERRIARFREAMGPSAPVVHGDWWDPERAEVAARKLLLPSPRPTAILCCGDPAAMVTLRTARALGLRVPEDLSVIGYGDYVMATYADPPLTTVAQPFAALGRAAVDVLLDENATTSLIPAILMVRGTTGQVRQ
jgi:LacI family transcriptional regulator